MTNLETEIDSIPPKTREELQNLITDIMKSKNNIFYAKYNNKPCYITVFTKENIQRYIDLNIKSIFNNRSNIHIFLQIYDIFKIADKDYNSDSLFNISDQYSPTSFFSRNMEYLRLSSIKYKYVIVTEHLETFKNFDQYFIANFNINNKLILEILFDIIYGIYKMKTPFNYSIYIKEYDENITYHYYIDDKEYTIEKKYRIFFSDFKPPDSHQSNICVILFILIKKILWYYDNSNQKEKVLSYKEAQDEFRKRVDYIIKTFLSSSVFSTDRYLSISYDETLQGKLDNENLYNVKDEENYNIDKISDLAEYPYTEQEYKDNMEKYTEKYNKILQDMNKITSISEKNFLQNFEPIKTLKAEYIKKLLFKNKTIDELITQSIDLSNISIFNFINNIIFNSDENNINWYKNLFNTVTYRFKPSISSESILENIIPLDILTRYIDRYVNEEQLIRINKINKKYLKYKNLYIAHKNYNTSKNTI